MAERAVSSVFQYLAPLLTGEVELLKGIRKEIVSIKAELERIHSFLKDAKSRAETGDKGVKIRVKQVRQVAYRIQDVIDEHILLVLPKQPGLFSSLHKVTQTITKLKPRHEIASQIQDIKTTIREIKEGANRYAFSTSTSSEHSSTSKDKMWRDPRLASLFIGDDKVVGIESPKYELISKLVDQNQSQRAVISVVGMGGIGKTTHSIYLGIKIRNKVPRLQRVFLYKWWVKMDDPKPKQELLQKIKEHTQACWDASPKSIPAPPVNPFVQIPQELREKYPDLSETELVIKSMDYMKQQFLQSMFSTDSSMKSTSSTQSEEDRATADPYDEDNTFTVLAGESQDPEDDPTGPNYGDIWDS
ncbi:unnamed protein product [Camellia sinensis]